MSKSKLARDRASDLVTGRDGPTDPTWPSGGGDGGGAGDGSGVIINKPTSQNVNVSKPIPDLRPADVGPIGGGGGGGPKSGATVKAPTTTVVTSTTKKKK